MKKLPKIYHSSINKKINNNKEMCVVEEKSNSEKVEDVLKKVYVGLGRKYNTKVLIETKDKTYFTTLISKSNEEIITEENKIIKIKDIRNITIKK